MLGKYNNTGPPKSEHPHRRPSGHSHFSVYLLVRQKLEVELMSFADSFPYFSSEMMLVWQSSCPATVWFLKWATSVEGWSAA